MCKLRRNGFIAYEEFAPVAAAQIRSVRDQDYDLERALWMEDNAPEPDTALGQNRMEMEQAIRDTFLKFDVDGNGTLDPLEFKECLQQTELMGRPLTEKEFNAVWCAVDEDKDGRISYDEFVEMVVDIMP